MSGWPARGLGAAAWIAVVAVGAVLVWLVISRAGAGLVAEAGPVTAPATAPAASDGASTTAPGGARRGTWQGDQGVVTATCRAGAIALVGAQPEDGMVVHVLDKGPDQLVVAFAGDDEAPVTVTGTCRRERPQFTVAPGAAGATSTPAPSGGSSSGGTDDHGTDDHGGSGSGSGHGSGDGSGDD